MSQENDNEFARITPGKVVKAAAVGAGVVGAALIAPIGIASVVGMGLVGIATSWFADSAGAAIKKDDRK
jgi:predicted homoserine dehydrogenase-like protein